MWGGGSCISSPLLLSWDDVKLTTLSCGLVLLFLYFFFGPLYDPKVRLVVLVFCMTRKLDWWYVCTVRTDFFQWIDNGLDLSELFDPGSGISGITRTVICFTQVLV